MPAQGAPAPPEGSYVPDDDAVLAALTALVQERGRPVWARDVRRRLYLELGRGGADGRWLAVSLKRLATQGRAVQLRRWRTDTSRWAVPDPTEVAEPNTGSDPPPSR